VSSTEKRTAGAAGASSERIIAFPPRSRLRLFTPHLRKALRSPD
jgi:hypothetical protein